MSKAPWYDSDNPTRIGWGITRWALTILLGLFVLSAVVWGASVALSDIAGRGGAVQIKNDAQNRVQQQAQFHQQFNAITSLDARLTDAQAQLAAYTVAHPTTPGGPYDPAAEQANNLQTTVTGLQQQCRIAVASYNALSQTYTAQDFRDANLPPQVDPADPTTDCVVTAADPGAPK